MVIGLLGYLYAQAPQGQNREELGLVPQRVAKREIGLPAVQLAVVMSLGRRPGLYQFLVGNVVISVNRPGICVVFGRQAQAYPSPCKRSLVLGSGECVSAGEQGVYSTGSLTPGRHRQQQ